MASGAPLFGRCWRVRVDVLQWEGITGPEPALAIAFEVEKSIKREPNTCKLRLWGLHETHRRSLEALSLKPLKTSASGGAPTEDHRKGKIRVEVEAGYKDATSLVFRGDLRRAVTTREGPELITSIEGEDGGRSILRSRVSRSFPAGTKLAVVVRAACDALGVGTGNIDEVQADLGLAFPEGTVLTGSASDELDRVLRSAGLTHSIQNGVLQVTRRGKALPAEAVKLSGASGLVGVPVANPDGTITAQSLIIPEVYPGRVINLDAERIKGFYTVTRTKVHGDTGGDDWYIDIEAKPRK